MDDTVELYIRNETQHVPLSEDWLFNDTLNIFVLHEDPNICAQMLCDKHVSKLSVEYTQLLCNARHLTHWKWYGRRETPKEAYRLTHEHHPCTKWAMAEFVNYMWLLDLAKCTWAEYKYRYKRDHKCSELLRFLNADITTAFPEISTRATQPSPPPQCIPVVYRVQHTTENHRRWENTVRAYRDYYIYEKADMAHWKNGRNAPDWFRGQESFGDWAPPRTI